jgi:carboxypeptidase C (cathepsin A)
MATAHRYGNKAWTLKLPWSGHEAFVAAADEPWRLEDGTQAGEARSANGLTFLRVFGGGHMVRGLGGGWGVGGC